MQYQRLSVFETTPLSPAEAVVARQYSPFRDPEPRRSFLHLGRKIGPSRMRVFRREEPGRIVEWRGQIPGGLAAFTGCEEKTVWG